MNAPEFLCRTPPLKTFQSRIGYSVANLNTLMVGLTAVKSGVAQKPDSLAVGWTGQNRPYLAAEARQLATRSLLVYAVDALDKYIEQVGQNSCLISDNYLRSILIGEPQLVSASATHVPSSELDKLRATLNKSEPNEIIEAIADLANRFGGKKRPAHIRAKFDALSNAFPAPTHYMSAVRLLVSWRNRHVHQSKERFSELDETEMLNNKAIFWDEHSHTDVAIMLGHYHERKGPSLKDISTLISVLQRTVRTIDEAMIAACDISEFARQALRKSLKQSGEAELRLKKLWGLTSETRRRKLTNYLRDFGFQSTKKDDEYGRQLPADFFANLVKSDLDPPQMSTSL